MTERYICVTCGVEHAPARNSGPPAGICAICADERQYIGHRGQLWTTMEQLTQEGRHNELQEEEPGLTSIVTVPGFAIGQRALLLQTAAGNVLWDCISYVDDATVAAVRALGGVQAIAVSHPHFYGTMSAWSDAFGGAPIYIPSADRKWVQCPHPAIRFWDGERIDLLPGVTLLRVGGHFDGACVVHWPAGANGKGVLLTGDTIAVVRDRRYVSFMYSYPNYIPLPGQTVRHIVEVVSRYPFDRIYGGFTGDVVQEDALHAVVQSANRYLAMTGTIEQ